MATHDYDIANQSGAAFRTDLNNALAAIQSNNSNSSSPATTVAYQWWADTTNGVLKIRNSANNDWVELLQLDGTLTLEDGAVGTPALAFRDDLNTGIYSSAADTFNVATAGVERMELGATTIFNEDGADVDFRIEGDTEANLFYVDAGNDRIGIRTSSPEDLLHLKGGKIRIENTVVSNNDSTISYDNQELVIDVDANNVRGSSSFQVKIDTVVALTVDDNRRLGIGTTSPSNKLHVEDSASGVIIAKQTTNNGGFNTFEGKASGGTTTFYVSHNGRVGAADGIIFGSDTAAANILHDYEEGTWTPTLLSGNSLSFSSGRYVKIGAMVYAFWEISLPSTSATDHMIINNTPFTSINHNASCGGTARDYQNFDIENGPIYHVNKADTKIQFYKNAGQNFVESDGSGKNFRGCSIYQTET